MSSRDIIQAAAGASGERVYVEDVFFNYLYIGNAANRTIVNGIDLAGEGGMIWTKRYNGVGNNWVFDTHRGVNQGLITEVAGGQQTSTNSVTAFNSNGFSLGTNSDTNGSGDSRTSWTFRKAPKFFDIVTYTGNRGAGSSPQTINHNLKAVPGFIIVKKVSSGTNNWIVYHRNNGTTSKQGWLNLANAFQNNSSSFFTTTAPTSTTFTVGTDADVNENGVSYIAYLFAHNAGGFGDTGTDNAIACGSYVGNGSTYNKVTVGFEPQWLLLKNIDTASDWMLVDSMRGFCNSPDGYDDTLFPNSYGTQDSNATLYGPVADGFVLEAATTATNANGSNYIYIAINRPNKPPTSGTQVFHAQELQDVNNQISTNFTVDAAIVKYNYWDVSQSNMTGSNYWFDRQRPPNRIMVTNGTQQETTNVPGVYVSDFDRPTGIWAGPADGSQGGNYAFFWLFGRRAGFFDTSCRRGVNIDNSDKPHNLHAVPELIITKIRSAPGSPYDAWFIWHKDLPANRYLDFTTSSLITPPNPSFGPFGTAAQMTKTTWRMQNGGLIDRAPEEYITHMFATVAGVSKVGSYTGNGSSQTINCGFTSGARFILIKRYDSSGDWYVWDSSRGYSGSTDKRLSWSSTLAQNTTSDTIGSQSSGFIVNQLSADNVNVTSATYVFLAIA